MNDDPSKKRLGRGLAALIGDIDRPVEERKAPVPLERYVPIEFVSRNPRNPRRIFTEAELEDLAQSIREHGIVQPIVVRPAPENREHFELIAGERRWRAAQRAGLTEIPVIMRDVDDRVALELAIIENVQRADLNPVEEAMGYQLLIDEHDYTQADLAQVIGKSRSHVANTLRLLKLPTEVQGLINDGALTAGHARTLITMENPQAVAERIVKEGLSVRQVEALSQAESKGIPAVKPERAPVEKDADTRALEKLLSDVTGMKVEINHRDRGGEVRIRYSSLEQLDEICRRLQS
ncbi:ParB/RepB/Spo0J family partition protein [Pseudochrobactrum algeriensis]|uniref:ParB family chromosome partitioning protein n=1 Tax=Pseudochrobactrum saccharolyticum TaxID=354352 RepID=A0A7W8EPL7_9HYPH|nr:MULTISPECIES: ParB/RepB/Spo0J family partition protein [Pseudochrobactrum]MBX8784401.1 ParB/RepB/Spo0J family partition protein [Ochrobactrum sp. GRS2]MBX8813678.1 ParB/RepB/Spo0J family partition protein [Ochrobactrum sp. MR34]KAB0540872.1 ParB/RepB/Spo0J family partition protein [Pseudochrobactrum saccharolyticum]MBB5090467.1 ParB family chromosome partitioning protein [Pseudochrobactrum saccharolyticum]MDP8252369.1 ParB/RepB/Spo0J family partition protein [Pseudochrobactrum saccharolytic